MKFLAPSTSVAASAIAALLAGSAWIYHRRWVEEQRILDAKEKQSSILVVDIGSSSVRASAYVHRHGTWVLVPGSLQQHKMRALASDGTADYHVIQRAVEHVMDATLRWMAAQQEFRVLGVGFSCFAMSLVGVGALGTPVTPVLTYAGKSAAEAKSLAQSLAAQELLQEMYNRTGVPIHPCYAGPQLLHHNPTAVHTWQSLVGTLLRHWTDAKDTAVPMSYSEASWTGLLAFRDAIWDAKLLELAQINPATLPPPQASSSSQPSFSPASQEPSVPLKAKLTTSYAKRWPLLRDAKMYLALADGAAANIGSKCSTPDRIGLTVGTSAAMRVMCPVAAVQKVPRGLWCYRVDATHALVGGALTDGGSVFEWATQTLAFPQDVHAQLAAMAPHAHGLSILPFFNGERAPGWHEDATCVISGIKISTTPVHMLRALMESVALRLATIHALFGNVASPNAVLVSSGTALGSSPLWRQIIADCIGRPVWIETDAIELTSRGIAIFTGAHLGLNDLQTVAPLHPDAHCAQPSTPAHATYLAARQAQDALYHNVLHR
ncbi:Aste57867_10100 [Aphanomyces stellatus]|uniref:Aste57867_10100 protein n=1 Tax=Aphanomyces stellatus TaxID=120398 RepID=A0A485KQ82_9STRA|nr:hypothetical protein As57867_010061 [Aphanomyces stellatus]VFT86976.1 Aste57867_10100 [Aphanomyces stellatus]